MDFLSSLHTDIKLLLVGAALALLAGLVSTTKKNEVRYLAVFTVLMVVAGLRFHQESLQEADGQAVRSASAGKAGKGPGQR